MSRSAFLLLSALSAVGIFLIDVLSPIEGAIAVLYFIAVLLASRTSRRGDIIAAAIACVALTVLALLYSHELSEGAPVLRALVSVAAIVITTLLALQNQAATEALAAQARLLNLSHDMIFVRDKKGVITFWNLAAEEVYGWSQEEAIDQVADDLLRTKYPDQRHSIEAELMDTGRWEGTLEQRTKSGAVLFLESRWALQRDHLHRPVGVLETHTDVTERRRSQDALLAAQAELAHAARVATLGEFTASIAHEVNQPLMAVVTNGEAGMRWLRRDVPDLEEVAKAIGRAVSEGRRASEIVNRIRAFLSKQPVQKGALDMAGIIEEGSLLVGRELSSEGVILHLEIEPELPAIMGDRVQLQQVLVNLMVNAAQAMSGQDGDRLLTVRARRASSGKLEVAVADTGPGIAEDDLARLFKPFFTTKKHGMGMGLAICRTTAEAHGGRLSAESAPGAGATFRLTLPVIEEKIPS